MNNQNMPILYQNVMFGLPSDFARDVFLWATDKFQNDTGAYKAEAFAREADQLVRTVNHLIDLRQLSTLRNGGILLDDKQKADLLRFAQARHANYRMGGNVKSAAPELING